MSENIPEKLMTTQEVADYLNIKVDTVRKKVQAETIPFIRLSRNCVHFDRKAIDKWIEQNTFTPIPRPLSLMRARRKRGAA